MSTIREETNIRENLLEKFMTQCIKFQILIYKLEKKDFKCYANKFKTEIAGEIGKILGKDKESLLKKAEKKIEKGKIEISVNGEKLGVQEGYNYYESVVKGELPEPPASSVVKSDENSKKLNANKEELSKKLIEKGIAKEDVDTILTQVGSVKFENEEKMIEGIKEIVVKNLNSSIENLEEIIADLRGSVSPTK